MARLRLLWIRLRDSLWFVPTLIVFAAVLLGMGMVELSGIVDAGGLSPWSRTLGVGPDGSRSMLSAVAGSMITVAGVTFSITMVAVTQASGQYTSRILRNFMRDRANQAVLGTFVGIFAYCLVVLRTIRAGDDAEFVPSLAVLVGVLLALVGIGVLIFFVHHIAATLQASEIVARISRDTLEVLDRLYPEDTDATAPAAPAWADETPGPPAWRAVPSHDSGYLQHVGVREIVRLAAREDLLVRAARPTGEFVAQGQPLCWVRQHDRTANGAWSRTERELRRTFVVGTHRTLDRDPAFGVRQLVDIALKALSPGINDSTTAVTCVDYLGGILLCLANRRIVRTHRDDSGRERLLTADPGFEALLALAVEEVRQNASGNVTVLERLLQTLAGVAELVRDPARRRAVLRHVELVRRAAERTVAEDDDRRRLEVLARGALAAP